jgi:hypothetical protein
LATSKLLMSDINLNWLRVFFPETAGITFKILNSMPALRGVVLSK